MGLIYLKVGIPRALLYYYYFPFWKTLFEQLGFEVVVSDETSKEMVNKGIKITVQEICVPIKVFNSHVLNLIEKNVDYIFIPRMVSIRKRETFCPKFLGLPDMSRRVFAEYSDRILSPKIRCGTNKINDVKSYKEMARKLGVSNFKLRKAVKEAEKALTETRKLSMKGYSLNDILHNNLTERNGVEMISPNTVNIGLMGYVYNIYDNFLSMDVITKFRNMGVNIVTFEMLPEETLLGKLNVLRKRLFWTFSNYLLGAGFYFLDNEQIDGIIHITAFGCGPDSYIGKIMELESEKKHKPFLTIRIDEHTGESHFITRIEAFTDMIKRKKFPHEGGIV